MCKQNKDEEKIFQLAVAFILLNAFGALSSKKKNETSPLRKEDEITYFVFRLLCNIRTYCLVAFPNANISFSKITFHSMDFCFLYLFFFLSLPPSPFVFFFFQKAIKGIPLFDACWCLRQTEHCYIFMIILICVASKFSHKASI